MGKFAESERFLRDALAIVPASPEPELATTRVLAISDLIRILSRLGKRVEGRLMLEQGREFAAAHLPADPHRAILLQSIGRFESGFDNRAAVSALEQSQQIFLANEKSEASELLENRWYVGNAYLEVGRLADAEAQLREAHGIDLKLYGPTDAETLRSRVYWRSRWRAVSSAEAAALLADARRTLQGKTEPKHLAMDAALAGRQMQVALLVGDLGAAERAAGAGEPRSARSARAGRAILRLGASSCFCNAVERRRHVDSRGLASGGSLDERFQWQLAQVRLQLAIGDALGAAQKGANCSRPARGRRRGHLPGGDARVGGLGGCAFG